MTEVADIHTLWTLLVGLVVIAAGHIEASLMRRRIQALVLLATCFVAPLILYSLLHRRPQSNETGFGT